MKTLFFSPKFWCKAQFFIRILLERNGQLWNTERKTRIDEKSEGDEDIAVGLRTRDLPWDVGRDVEMFGKFWTRNNLTEGADVVVSHPNNHLINFLIFSLGSLLFRVLRVTIKERVMQINLRNMLLRLIELLL